jgi:hypothetical protein
MRGKKSVAKQLTGHTMEYVYDRVVRRGEYFTGRGLGVFANKPAYVVQRWIRGWVTKGLVVRLMPARLGTRERLYRIKPWNTEDWRG